MITYLVKKATSEYIPEVAFFCQSVFLSFAARKGVGTYSSSRNSNLFIRTFLEM